MNRLEEDEGVSAALLRCCGGANAIAELRLGSPKRSWHRSASNTKSPRSDKRAEAPCLLVPGAHLMRDVEE